MLILGGGFIGLEMGTFYSTLSESIGMAAEVAHGSCTDLPPSKK